MKHTIHIGPPWFRLGEIVWDDVDGTVSGTVQGLPSHRRIPERLRAMIGDGPTVVGCPWGSLRLQDPAHDAADFMRAFHCVMVSNQQFSLPDSLASVSPTPFPLPSPRPSPTFEY